MESNINFGSLGSHLHSNRIKSNTLVRISMTINKSWMRYFGPERNDAGGHGGEFYCQRGSSFVMLLYRCGDSCLLFYISWFLCGGYWSSDHDAIRGKRNDFETFIRKTCQEKVDIVLWEMVTCNHSMSKWWCSCLESTSVSRASPTVWVHLAKEMDPYGERMYRLDLLYTIVMYII